MHVQTSVSLHISYMTLGKSFNFFDTYLVNSGVFKCLLCFFLSKQTSRQKKLLQYLLLLCGSNVMSDSFATLWTIAHQAPLSIGFPRQDAGVGYLFLF